MSAAPRTAVPTEPKRIQAFARFFKSYMSVSSVVTASLPIPVTAMQLIPTYAAQTRFLSTYTSLFCFLLLAFLFYSRHALARAMFRKRGSGLIAVAPLVLIVASLSVVFAYHATLDASVREAQAIYLQKGIGVYSTQAILAQTDPLEIPRATTLIGLHMAMFLAAECAFILMALREYLQDLLGLDEVQLIGVKAPS